MTEIEVTRTGERWSNADADTIEIWKYNPEWPHLFQLEARRLQAVVPDDLNVSIEHFGSTAIPGQSAKPVIDILLVTDAPSAWSCIIDPICSLGYRYWSSNPDPYHLFFVKGMPPYGERRTHHVHVRRSPESRRYLRFRDLLRASPTLAYEYEQLKRNLAQCFRHDRDAYTAGKTEFVSQVLMLPDVSSC